MPVVHVGRLRPYVSLLLLEALKDYNEGVRALNAFLLSELRARAGEAEEVATGIEPTLATVPGIEASAAGGLLYRSLSAPSWAAESSTWTDVEHHLTLVVQRNQLIAVYASEDRVRGSLQRWVDDTTNITRVPPEHLNAAFATGEARTVWMAAGHSRLSLRPDAKAVTGRHVQDTFDPLTDQTFVMNAVRAVIPDDIASAVLAGQVILSSSKGTVSYKQSPSWQAFMRSCDGILARVEQVRAGPGLESPLPILGTRTYDLSRVRDPYEVVAPSPGVLELMPEATIKEIEAAELLSDALLEVCGSNGPAVDVDVGLDGARAGTLRLTPRKHGRSRILIEVGVPNPPSDHAITAQIREALQKATPEIYYMSNHAVMDGAVYHFRFRDHPFLDWEYADFSGFDIGREKPGDGSRSDIEGLLGASAGDDSLFGWVLKHWVNGWLVCDDGTDEVADFVHLDDESEELTLIHVKHATSCSGSRQVACGPYETVVSQAIKNLRALDGENLEAELSSGWRQISRTAWWDGECLGSRELFLERLHSRRPTAAMKVVIVQPHITGSRLRIVRDRHLAGINDLEVARLRKLDALLHGARATCAGFGAEFVVVVSDS